MLKVPDDFIQSFFLKLMRSRCFSFGVVITNKFKSHSTISTSCHAGRCTGSPLPSVQYEYMPSMLWNLRISFSKALRAFGGACVLPITLILVYCGASYSFILFSNIPITSNFWFYNYFTESMPQLRITVCITM